MGEKKIVQIISEDGYEVYTLEGFGAESPAIKVENGFTTDGVGQHCFCNSFAYAELGELDENLEYRSIVWEEEDLGKHIFTKSVLGWPKEYESWNPGEKENEVNWIVYEEWVKDYCNRVL